MLEETTTTIMTRDRNDMTATTPSIRRHITMRTTTSPTIPHRTTRAHPQGTARSQTTTGKTSRMADRCWEAAPRMGLIPTT